MEPITNLIVHGVALDLSALQERHRRPPLFAPGESRFWDDPHISEQMLTAHIHPQSDAASRRPHVIDRELTWLASHLQLAEGDAVLDLGCGPGLYAARLAKRRLRVTGVDYAQRAIAWARDHAEAQSLQITYVLQDYLEMDYEAQFDAAMLVNGDFGVLNPDRRQQLLQRIRRALKPGGRLVIDVVTQRFRSSYMARNQWYVASAGFWRPQTHLVLEEGFDYPKAGAFLNQYIVVDPDGTTTVYRNWFQTFSPSTISAELAAGGFAVEHLGGNLRGDPYTDQSEWIGIVARMCNPASLRQ